MAMTMFFMIIFTSVVAARADTVTFDWNLIRPSTDLQWVECYTPPIECARLIVPLNYSNPDAYVATIALARVPSPLNGTDAYRGPVLYNPGGPGASGVEHVVAWGSSWNSEEGGLLPPEFDLVSFDPRGIGFSTPRIELFKSEPEMADYDALSLEMSPESWDTLSQRLDTMHDFNERINDDFGDRLIHMTTENVAMDMVTMMDAFGLEKLRYYGVSYGTVLGVAFASMFPDKVESMILDAVDDIPGYYSADYTLNILDADRTLLYILSACSAAGPDACAFHEPSVEEITRRFHSIINSLESEPFVIRESLTYTQTDILFTIHGLLYSHDRYPTLIEVLLALESRDAYRLRKALWPSDQEDQSMRKRKLPVKLPFNTTLRNTSISINALKEFTHSRDGTPHGGAVDQDALLCYWCTDAEPFRDTVEQLEGFATRTREVSTYFPAVADMVRMACSGWKVNPQVHRAASPIGAEGVPMLFIGNTFDPITPLEAAKRTAAAFPGSVWLRYDAPGHGAVTSPCIQDHMKTFLLSGDLPSPGTVCEMTEPLFGDKLAPAPSQFDFEGLPLEDDQDDRGDDKRGHAESGMGVNLLALIFGPVVLVSSMALYY